MPPIHLLDKGHGHSCVGRTWSNLPVVSGSRIGTKTQGRSLCPPFGSSGKDNRPFATVTSKISKTQLCWGSSSFETF